MKKYFKIYTFSAFIKLIFNIFRTRISYPGAKIIRFPFDIRGRNFIKWGFDFTTGIGCRLEAYPDDNKSITISIGNNVQINDYVHITGINNIVIGDNVLIASKVYISDSSHGSYAGDKNDSDPTSIPKNRPLFSKAICIEDNVWLGEMVSVLPGVTIGKGTIVGANSVVTRSLPANVIAVGVPAKPIKRYNFEKQRWENIN
jgi:acetyltransferase-like isoleucine patch superfamily enzyme